MFFTYTNEPLQFEIEGDKNGFTVILSYEKQLQKLQCDI